MDDAGAEGGLVFRWLVRGDRGVVDFLLVVVMLPVALELAVVTTVVTAPTITLVPVGGRHVLAWQSWSFEMYGTGRNEVLALHNERKKQPASFRSCCPLRPCGLVIVLVTGNENVNISSKGELPG